MISININNLKERIKNLIPLIYSTKIFRTYFFNNEKKALELIKNYKIVSKIYNPKLYSPHLKTIKNFKT